MSVEGTSNSKCKERRSHNDKRYSYLTAVEEVLKRNPKQTSLHYKEITERALAEKLIVSGAKDPARSLYAAVYNNVKREHSRFRLDKKTGLVSLAAWQGAQVLQSVDEHNKKTREHLLSLLRGMSGGQLEKFVAYVLLPGMGFEDCSATQLSHDNGIDACGRFVITSAVYVNVRVQVKGGKNRSITPSDIRALRGTLKPQEQGLFITTGKFTKAAHREAEGSDGTKSHICLIDGDRLADDLLDLARNGKGDGIRIETKEMFILDKTFFKNYGSMESTKENE